MPRFLADMRWSVNEEGVLGCKKMREGGSGRSMGGCRNMRKTKSSPFPNWIHTKSGRVCSEISRPFLRSPAKSDEDDADKNEAAKKEHEDDEPGV